MTVKVSKPAINVREELADLRKPTGVAGEAMLRAETPQEQFNLIGAGRRNLIINGGMQIWQRGTSAATAPNGYSTVDRWKIYESSEGAYTSEQSTEHPTESGYSLKCQVTTADTSIAASQYAFVETNLEGQNVQQVQYGTSNAQHLTVSFWVKSNKTGTYCVALLKFSGSGTAQHMYRKEYTINTANTWEKKTVTIPPLTTSSGKIPNTNGGGFQLVFGFAWGSNFQGTDNTWDTGSGYGTSNQVNWMDSTSNNFYLAEVQLEVGKVATPFEHRSYGEELALCQRYYQKHTVADTFQYIGNVAVAHTSTIVTQNWQLNPTMRAAPQLANTGWRWKRMTNGLSNTTITGTTLQDATANDVNVAWTVGSTTVGYVGMIESAGTSSAYIAFDAEL